MSKVDDILEKLYLSGYNDSSSGLVPVNTNDFPAVFNIAKSSLRQMIEGLEKHPSQDGFPYLLLKDVLSLLK